MTASAASVAKHSVWLTSGFIIAKFSQLISQVILTHLLVPEDFGLWGMVVIMTSLSALFKDWAIAAVLIQRGLDDKKLVNAVYSLGVNVSIGLCLLQSLLGYPLALFFNEPTVFPLTVLTSLVFLIGAGTGSHTAVLQRRMQFDKIAITNAVSGLVRLTATVVCAVLGGGVWSFAAGEVAASISDSIQKRWYSRYPFDYQLFPDRKAVQEVSGFISSLVGINLAVYANTNSDNFLIGKLLGARHLGYYALAYQLAMIPTFAVTQLNRVSFSVLSQQNNDEKLSHMCGTIEAYSILYTPIYGAAFVIAPWLIPVLYGPSWSEAVILFQIVLFFAYARGFMSILGTVLNALNKPHINAAINWALVPLSVPAYFVGAKLGGTTGVAIAVALVMGAGATVWFWVMTCRAAGWSVTTLVKPVIAPAVATAIAVTASVTVPFPGSLKLFISLPVMLLVYLLVVSVLTKGEVTRKTVKLVKSLLKLK